MDNERKPLIFVAAVYEGNAYEWARGLMRAGEALRQIAPIVPVLPHLRIIDIHRTVREAWERDLLAQCAGMVIVGGREAPQGAEGLDVWDSAALEAGVPVFESPADLVSWLADAYT